MSLLKYFDRAEAIDQIDHGIGSMDDRGIAMTMWAIYEKAHKATFEEVLAKLSDEELAEVIAGMIQDEAEFIDLEDIFRQVEVTEGDVVAEFGSKEEDEDED